MIEKIKNIINQAERFYVLGITINGDQEHYHLLEILFKDETLSILNRADFSELNTATIKYFKKDYPIILHLEGDSIISKDTQSTIGYRNNLIFKSNPDEFYFYEYHQDDKVYVSLTRKETITTVLAKINELDKYVVHIALGPFVLTNLLLILKHEEALLGGNYELRIKDSDIVSYEKTTKTNFTYKIGDDSINENETALLASLIDYLYPNPNIKADVEHLDFNKEQYKFKKYFKLYGSVVLIIIVLALFASHFILQKNLKELAEKESLISISNQTLIQLNELKEERVLKEKVLMTSGVIDNNYAVKYFSDIGKSIPMTISLDFIKVKNPVKNIKPNEKVVFNLSAIEIGGYTTNDNSFNNWVKSLKQIDWVKQIEIVKYREDSRSENYFLISIEL